MAMVGSGDVARPPRAGPATVERLMHGLEHGRVLPHAKVVVRAPDRHLGAAAAVPVVGSAREISGVTLEIGKYPIATLRVKSIELCTEERFIVHNRLRTSGLVWAARRQRRPMSTPSSIRSTVRSLRTRSIESLGCAARKAGPPSRGPMFLSRIAPALSGISQELPRRHGGDPAHHARDVAWQLESERRLPDQPTIRLAAAMAKRVTNSLCHSSM